MIKDVCAENLTVSLNGKNIFSNLSFSINKGEKVSIIGESGSGKTTLLNTLCGFITNYKGTLTIKGKQVNKNNIFTIRKKHIAWLPQEITAGFETAEELFFYPFSFKNNEHLQPSTIEINEIFQNFGIDREILKKKLSEISGGQKQRIALASIILLRKDIILLDEPSSALDEKNIKKVTDYIFSLKTQTIISTSHNPYWISKSDKTINIENYAK
jgi:putative ABC transport system ATP-binding protein